MTEVVDLGDDGRIESILDECQTVLNQRWIAEGRHNNDRVRFSVDKCHSVKSTT